MNPGLERLQPYPFARLRMLLADVEPPAGLQPIDLGIGEPRGAVPELVREALVAALPGLSRYPSTQGEPELRAAIADWLERRFALEAGTVDPATEVLPVSGTREALFALAQCFVSPQRPLVLVPNPGYQVYEGAALLAGGEPHYLALQAAQGYRPQFADLDPAVLERTALLYLCSPGNPTGAVLERSELEQIITLARRHRFIVAADECYSEIYADDAAPPPGLLEAAAALGNGRHNCLVLHSLSKRSGVPGLRSGFVAGDADLIAAFALYRSYHGCTMAPPVQAASAAAWRDEAHVRDNRQQYRQRFAAVHDILSPVVALQLPPGGFYLWLRTPGDDCAFARTAWQQAALKVLPGSFLGRDRHGSNPGAGHVRVELVHDLDTCREAAQRLCALLARH